MPAAPGLCSRFRACGAEREARVISRQLPLSQRSPAVTGLSPCGSPGRAGAGKEAQPCPGSNPPKPAPPVGLLWDQPVSPGTAPGTGPGTGTAPAVLPTIPDRDNPCPAAAQRGRASPDPRTSQQTALLRETRSPSKDTFAAARSRHGVCASASASRPEHLPRLLLLRAPAAAPAAPACCQLGMQPGQGCLAPLERVPGAV